MRIATVARPAITVGTALTVLVLVAGCKVTVHAGPVVPSLSGPGPIPTVQASGGGQGHADSPYYQETLAAIDVLNSDSRWAGTLGEDAAAIRADSRDAGSDLADARSDARGDNTGCSAASNAANDAEDIHDLGTLGEDENSLTESVDRIDRDIDQLQVELSELKNTGVKAPAGAPAVIAGAKARIARAVAEANAGIRAVNADVVAAYAAANKVAKGLCSSESPGSPPPAYPLLSANA